MAVYLIQAGGLPIVKIGMAKNPEARLKDHQCGHWEELKIIRLWEGGRKEERMLHKKFSDLHIRGEWFSLSKVMFGDVGLSVIPHQEKNDIKKYLASKCPVPAKASIPEYKRGWTPEQKAKLSIVRAAFFSVPGNREKMNALRKLRITNRPQQRLTSAVINSCGGIRLLASSLNINMKAIYEWHVIPAKYELHISQISGIPIEQFLVAPSGIAA